MKIRCNSEFNWFKKRKCYSIKCENNSFLNTHFKKELLSSWMINEENPTRYQIYSTSKSINIRKSNIMNKKVHYMK